VFENCGAQHDREIERKKKRPRCFKLNLVLRVNGCTVLQEQSRDVTMSVYRSQVKRGASVLWTSKWSEYQWGAQYVKYEPQTSFGLSTEALC
jgi:hypothetical protein